MQNWVEGTSSAGSHCWLEVQGRGERENHAVIQGAGRAFQAKALT